MGFLSRFRGSDDEPEDQAYHPEPAPTDVA
jgi:hypothetical protein